MKDLLNFPVLHLLILSIFGCGPLTSLADGGENRLVVSLAGENRLDVFVIGKNGIPELQSQTGIAGSPGPSRFDHTGQNLYVGTSNPATISVFRTQPHGLKFLQSVAVTQKPAFMAVTPNRGDGSIAVFAIDDTTGKMKFIDRTDRRFRDRQAEGGDWSQHRELTQA